MLLPALHLVRRLRGRADARAVEVGVVRRRIAAAARDPASEEARALARELRELRPQVMEAFDGVRACGCCARGRPLPHGRWAGGFCCGGRTLGVFDDDEIAALALGGTRPRHLTPPAPPEADLAGCAFRGPAGCSLDARDRPSLCVRFVCRELEAELRADGEWARVRALTRRLEETFARFRKARAATGEERE